MRKFLIALIIVLSMPNLVHADSVGEIKGLVTMNGKAVGGAEVVLITESMETVVRKTNNEGYYSFKGLDYGKYLITVKIDGKFYVSYKVRK